MLLSTSELLEDLSEKRHGGDDLLDLVYSKRYRKEVLNISERMMSPDYVDDDSSYFDDDIRALRKCISKFADCQRRLSVYEQESGFPWLSLCYPSPLDIVNSWSVFCFKSKVEPLVPSGMPEGKAGDIHNSEPPSDVVSLLSFGGGLSRNNGELVVFNAESKYVMVFFINMPSLVELNGFQSLLNLCYELHSERDDVEMVMVARMNMLADTKEVFDRVFSEFPSSCLAVPYEDWERRERVRKLFKYHACETPLCLVYNTDGLFLTSFELNDYKIQFGAEAFPFTEEMVEKIGAERLRLRRGGLENLLKPYESSPEVVVYEFNPSLGPHKEPRRISEVIKNKHVGLYLCCEGGKKFLPLLHKVYERCKEKQLAFEIVVLYIPLPSAFNPDLFKDGIDDLLQEHGIRGWWCLPFNNSVSLGFWNITHHYDNEGQLGFGLEPDWEDKLIIVGPDGKILDIYGAEVIGVRGIDVYPFTRAAVVEKKMKKVRQLRLESLLIGQLFRGKNPRDVISADTLLSSKKKVIVYMGEPLEYDYEWLVSQYDEMKEKIEVIFVECPRGGEEIGVTNDMEFAGMPWYIHCPLDGTYTCLAKELSKLTWLDSLFGFGFGEDGHICSVKSLRMLDNVDGIARLCLDDTLYQDMYEYYGYNKYNDI